MRNGYLKVFPGNAIPAAELEDLKSLWRQYETRAPLPPNRGESIFPEHPDHFRYLSIMPTNSYALYYNEEGKVIAAAIIVLVTVSQKSYAKLEDLVVGEQYRGQGYGTAFLNDLVNWIVLTQCYFFVQVDVHPDRKQAGAFLTKSGFVLVSCAMPDTKAGVNVHRKTLVPF